jgi:CRP-like cAMP-binding protein
MTEDRSATLRTVPLFEHLDDKALEHVSKLVTDFDAPAGHVLVEAKREASGAFIILDGTAVVEVGSKHIDLGPGDVIGEMALVSSEAVRSARVRTTSQVRGVAIARADFRELLAQEPAIALALLEVLARRLAAMDQA